MARVFLNPAVQRGESECVTFEALQERLARQVERPGDVVGRIGTSRVDAQLSGVIDAAKALTGVDDSAEHACVSLRAPAMRVRSRFVFA